MTVGHCDAMYGRCVTMVLSANASLWFVCCCVNHSRPVSVCCRTVLVRFRAPGTPPRRCPASPWSSGPMRYASSVPRKGCDAVLVLVIVMVLLLELVTVKVLVLVFVLAVVLV